MAEETEGEEGDAGDAGGLSRDGSRWWRCSVLLAQALAARREIDAPATIHYTITRKSERTLKGAGRMTISCCCCSPRLQILAQQDLSLFRVACVHAGGLRLGGE